MKIRLKIEYDGTDFFGWQTQGNLPTIQSSIEEILERVTGQRITCFGSGRTDSGVHAKGQVAHFSTTKLDIPAERWKSVLNYNLPSTIRVLASEVAPEDFHAQRSAVSKIYEYRVLNRKTGSALDRCVYFFPHEVDWDRVRRALPHFVGEKDFSSFKGAKAEVVTTVREIYRFDLDVENPREQLYRFTVEGSGFLKQMVRTMIGTVLEVGEGKRSPEDIPGIISACDRMRAGRTAPARGLCLVSVKYPTECAVKFQ